MILVEDDRFFLEEQSPRAPAPKADTVTQKFANIVPRSLEQRAEGDSFFVHLAL